MIPGLSTAKLIGLGLGVLAILTFVGLSLHWRHEMTSRGEQLATICQKTRAAADNPKLDCKAVPQQIELLGKDVADLKAAIGRQNDAVVALAQQSAQQQQEAAQASRSAQERARAAQATSERLAASSRAGEAQAKPCAPSKALEGAWR